MRDLGALLRRAQSRSNIFPLSVSCLEGFFHIGNFNEISYMRNNGTAHTTGLCRLPGAFRRKIWKVNIFF